MIQKVVAIIVFVLVVCTIAGCTGTSSQNSPTPTPTPTLFKTHDTFAILGRDFMLNLHLRFDDAGNLITESGQLIAKPDEMINADIITQRVNSGQSEATPTPTSVPTATPTTAPANHDPVLTAFVEYMKSSAYAPGHSVDAWEVIWHNDTSVTVQETVRGILANDKPLVVIDTITAFPSTKAASDYLITPNTIAPQKTDYAIGQGRPLVYLTVTGHYPILYRQWETISGSASNLPIYDNTLTQYDNVVDSAYIASYGAQLA